MKTMLCAVWILLLSGAALAQGPSNGLTDLLDGVQGLNLSFGGYTLGKALTESQRQTAARRAVAHDHPQLQKFTDGALTIVAHRPTHRVVILYEQVEPAPSAEIRDRVGRLFLEFGQPTVYAHDRVIYWVFGPAGKLTQADYKSAKDKGVPMDTLATVKLNSSVKITKPLEKASEASSKASETSGAEDAVDGSIYTIFSSQPVLERILSSR